MANYGKKLEVQFTAALPGILADLTKNSAVLRRKALAIGDEVIEIIRDRTAEGIDVAGRPFRKYSNSYEEFKRAAFANKKTRKLVGKTGWLRASGRMLASLQAKNIQILTSGTGISIKMFITFSDKERAQIAEYHDKLGAGKSKVKRRFLGLSTNSARRKAELARLLQTWRKAR